MEYNKILRRLAENPECFCDGVNCHSCPNGPARVNGTHCEDPLKTLQLDEFLSALEKWDKEHPQKTYQQDFYEKFPHGYNHRGVPEICVRRTNELFKCPHGYMDDRCRQCFHEHPEEHAACWNTPMPEEDTK